MKLSSLLNQEFIFLNADVSFQEEAVSLMVDKVYKDYSFETDKDTLLQTIAEREKQGHTILDGGIAIPHARLDHFDDFIISFCVPRKPFVLNGKEVKMVVMILVSHASPALHLNTLAAIAGLIQNKPMLENLLKSQNPQAFINVFEEANFKVKNDLTVADIMSTHLVSVEPQTTLKEIVNLMVEHRASYLPVVDSKGQIMGEITVLEILKKGLPDYVRGLENLSFLSSLSAFEDLLKNEETITAADVMREVQHRIKPSAPVVEVALVMMQDRERHILIEEDGKILGVVSYMDMLSKVLRG